MSAASASRAPEPTSGVPVESIHEEIQKILASRRFAASERHCRLLRYLLEHTLDGRGDQIKEYTLGIEVFDRRDSFDPQTDPIVRTELSRLRAKLKDYFETDGRDDALLIDLPRRCYSLTFERRDQPKAAATKPSWSLWSAPRVVVATVLILGVAGYWAVVLAHNNILLHTPQRERLDAELTTVVVLPFINLSGDKESEYFSDGLAEELIQRLAEVEGLRVIPRTSAFQFKGTKLDVRSIAGQLHASLVLEGAVRRAGDRLRVTIRLVNGADGWELGSHVYDRGLQDAIAVQEEISRQVAKTLRLPGNARGGTGIARHTQSLKAYDEYLKGRYHASDGTEQGLRKAAHCFENAVAADPGFAAAHSSLADAYIQAALMYEAPPGDTMLRAKEAARRAVETGKSLSHAHSVLASVLALYDKDWSAASMEFSQALELDPNDASIREAYAMRYLLPRNRMNAALFQLQFALNLDPFSTEVAASLGKVHHFRRDPDPAIEIIQKLLRMDPGFEAAQVILAKAYLQKSLPAQALATLQHAPAPVEDEARMAVLGHAYALASQEAQARRILEHLNEFSRQRYVSGYYFALVHIGLGEKGPALDWLEKAHGEHSPLIVYLGVNPLFDSLRSEPRFRRLLQQTGLGE